MIAPTPRSPFRSTSAVSRTPASKRCGFALLITITLLAFLVLLLVSLAALTRVETQVAGNNQQLAQARQNALMALNIALGELQRTAGPDRRVTAKANILETPAVDVIAGKENWTGVWLPGVGTAPAQWLVSGAKTAAGVPDLNAHTSAVSSNAVQLVGAGSATSSEYDAGVKVEPELINSTLHPANPGTSVAVGRMAYWVGDEGVKARSNLRDPYVQSAVSVRTDADGNAVVPALTPTADQRRLRLAVAQRFGIEKMATNVAGTDFLGDALFPLGTDSSSAANAEFIARTSALTDDAQTAFLNGLPADLRKNRFHDLTVHSYGLLTNTATGGLREDLTHLFEKPSDATFTTALTTASVAGLTTSGGSTKFFQGADFPVAAEVVNGPTWEQLRNFYRIKDTLGGATEVTIRPQSAMQHGVAPLITQFRMMSGASLYRQNMNQNIPRAHMYFAIVLANPYDVRIVGTNVGVSVGFIASFGYEFIANSAPALGAPTPGNYGNFRLRQAVEGIRFTIPALSLEPGEARVYTPKRTALPAVFMGDASSPYLFATGNPNSLVAIEMENVYDDSDANTLVYQPPLNPATGITDAQIIQYTWYRTFGNTGNFSLQLLDGSGALLQRIYGGSLDLMGYQSKGIGQDMSGVTVGTSSSVTRTGGWGYSLLGPWHNRQYPYIGQIDLRSPHYAFPTKTTGANWTTIAGARDRNQYIDEMAGTNIDEVAPNDITGSPRVAWGPYTERTGTAPGLLPSGWADKSFQFENPIYSMPRAGMVSIGQLVHANLGGVPQVPYVLNGGTFESAYNAVPTYAIGNSHATPLIKRELTKYSGAGWTDPAARDVSYFANKTLFDGYYFSTIPQSAAFNFKLDQLPNSRMKPFGTSDIADYRIDKFSAARHMRVAGAFNVNSTSKQAWRALLGSLRGAQLNGESNLNAPFPRTLYPSGGSADVTKIKHRDAATGFRDLTDANLDLLAAEIVKETKARASAYGPSRSLAEFVNRRLEPVASSNASFGLKGILQTALDNTVNGVNFAITTDMSGPMYGPNTWYTENSNKLPQRLTGLRGWLMQSDLLQPLGPIISARSDTFRIRVRGDALNPVLNTAAAPAVSPESIAASAWCEAIVQRVPDYLNTVNASDTLPANLNAENQSFGRRFKIVSFRWLSQAEL